MKSKSERKRKKEELRKVRAVERGLRAKSNVR
jgi:hypothetical protein